MQNRSGRVSGCAACWGKGRPTTQFDSVSAKVSHLREAAQPCSCGLAKKPRSLLTFASPCVSNATPIYFFVRASVHCDCKQPVGCLWSTFSLTVRRGHAGDPQFLWAWWTCVGQCLQRHLWLRRLQLASRAVRAELHPGAGYCKYLQVAPEPADSTGARTRCQHEEMGEGWTDDGGFAWCSWRCLDNTK